MLNRGFSGYNTEWALPVFEQVRKTRSVILRCDSFDATDSLPVRQIFAKQHEQQHVPLVRLLTIWFGANDACIPGTPQHVPLPHFTENLLKMIQMVQSPSSPYYSPDTKIILISAPPVNTRQRGADLASRDPPKDLDRLFEKTQTYAEEVVRLGKKEGLPVVDAWTKLWEAAGKEESALKEYLYDGLHVNEAGYKVCGIKPSI